MSSEAQLSLATVRTPKLPGNSQAMWYRYYAGFSTDFVGDMVRVLGLNSRSRVVDPWMGSGTTLAVAGANDATVAGLDLNPAMAVIAKGRLIAVDTEESVEPLMMQVSQHWSPGKVSQGDLLTSWFSTRSAANVRGMVARIDELLVNTEVERGDKASRMSSIAAFYYVAAFRTVREMLGAFSSSNPTWMKGNKPGDGAIEVSASELSSQFEDSVRHLATFIRYRRPIPIEVRDHCAIMVGDSRSQPFEDGEFDAVVTSPPYLTRLDYVIGHLPELAVLGLSSTEVADLRLSMIGTPRIASKLLGRTPIGPAASATLRQIEEHPSYAAKSYYAKNFRQYFEGMADSFSEISRVTQPGAPVALVVQDSHFKELHIDLASILGDQAVSMGWSQVARKDFLNLRSMAQLNVRAHSKARTTKPTESVLLFESS